VQLDLDLLRQAIGGSPVVEEALDTGGYTRSRAWRVATSDGPSFVKQAEEAGSLHMLRREAAVYRNVRGPFLPAFVGFADSGEQALLAIEYLENALWPPPYPDDVTPLFDALEAVGATEPPVELPAHGRWAARWKRVAADPERFLGLGLCPRSWLESSLETLIAAEEGAEFSGSALVHNDVYSENVGFTGRGAVLVDWGASVRGSPWIDVAFALLSLRVEDAVPPQVDFPDEAAFAAALAGHFAVEAAAPLPDWAAQGSTLREDMRGDLGYALAWCVETLGLPPLR